MITRGFLTVLSATALLVGCTAPAIKGDSAQSQKLVSFPKMGIPVTTAVGNLAVLYSDYYSQHVFRLTRPFKVSVMLLNKIEVSPQEQLFQSELDGETMFCTEHNTYFDALTGPWAVACFKSTIPGKFNTVTYRPGAVWFNKDISPAIEYESREVQASGQTKSLKRELIFEGRQHDTLLFSERIYETSLNTPSKIKPLMANVVSAPAVITLDGMDIRVIRVDDASLTFEVIKPWQ